MPEFPLSAKPRCLVVVPAFNEAERLPQFLDGIARTLRERDELDVEIVDDGSHEEEGASMRASTAAAASSAGLRPERLRYRRHAANRGKGAVLRDAFAAHAREGAYKVLGFLDADGSTPFSEGARLAARLIVDGADVDAYIGCRLKCLGIPIERKVSRHLSGRVFATLLSNLFDMPVYDSQCGAKMFKASHLTPELLRLCDDDRWLFDTQLVISLWAMGRRVREIPVEWREVRGSKVSLLRDPPRMALGLLRFRRRLAQHGLSVPPASREDAPGAHNAR